MISTRQYLSLLYSIIVTGHTRAYEAIVLKYF